jgi:adenylyl cyclase-associated protein
VLSRADRSGAVPASASSAAASFSAAAAAPAVKQAGPPKLVLESGRKWVVENQLDNKSIVIEDTNPRQTVYVYNCSKSVIQVRRRMLAASSQCVVWP